MPYHRNLTQVMPVVIKVIDENVGDPRAKDHSNQTVNKTGFDLFVSHLQPALAHGPAQKQEHSHEADDVHE